MVQLTARPVPMTDSLMAATHAPPVPVARPDRLASLALVPMDSAPDVPRVMASPLDSVTSVMPDLMATVPLHVSLALMEPTQLTVLLLAHPAPLVLLVVLVKLAIQPQAPVPNVKLVMVFAMASVLLAQALPGVLAPPLVSSAIKEDPLALRAIHSMVNVRPVRHHTLSTLLAPAPSALHSFSLLEPRLASLAHSQMAARHAHKILVSVLPARQHWFQLDLAVANQSTMKPSSCNSLVLRRRSLQDS